MVKTILVTGATGKQGGAVIDNIINSPQSSDFEILAITRDTSSASAQKLARKSSTIKLVQANMDDTPALFKLASEAASEPLWGVFSVQVPMGKGATPETEEAQGKAVVDEALKYGVKYFVYTSVDRGGDEISTNNPTPIPHFISKHNIEHHLMDKTKDGQMDWFILRPVAFMDNLTPDFFGKMFATAWKQALPVDKKLQFIATTDIGHFAAEAFLKPDEWKGKALSLAGDDLTFAEANRIFRSKTAREIPTTFGFLGAAVLAISREFRIHDALVRHGRIRRRYPEGQGDVPKADGLWDLVGAEEWVCDSLMIKE